jgi:hypothetical protein
MLSSLWKDYGPSFVQPRTLTALETIARDITRNTRLPLPVLDHPDSWKTIFSGKNTRWETLGLLFCSLALEIAAKREKNELLVKELEKSKKESLSELKACVEMCIE